ncbi:hypothetical protein FGIG_03565 [Fasciola gigantica]|uniref:Uncharacterized protein n=1 Tax=Fasciola gigantica TaxID=46835 RepID=A0A504YSP8_FASGI|nr:hypothetical protein FGIG_03565 [Fasciola gigantica]
MEDCAKSTLDEADTATGLVSLPGVLPWRDCPNGLPSMCCDTLNSLQMVLNASEKLQRDSTLEDKSYWLSRLQQVPCEDRQLCKLSSVHTDFECVMHHQETDYAHHTHYLHSQYHHHHHHHHHHHYQHHHNGNSSDCLGYDKISPDTLTRHIQEKLRQSRLHEVQTHVFSCHAVNGVDSVKLTEDLSSILPFQFPGFDRDHHHGDCNNGKNQNHARHHHHHHYHHHQHVQNRCHSLQPQHRAELVNLTENELAKLTLKAFGSHQLDRFSSSLSGLNADENGADPVGDSDNKLEPPDSWDAIQNRVMNWLNGLKETIEFEQDTGHESEAMSAISPVLTTIETTNGNQLICKTTENLNSGPRP